MNRLRTVAILAVVVGLFSTACVRKVTIPEPLPVNAPLATEELISRINRYQEVKTFSSQGTVYVRNYLTGRATKAEEFPEANQLIRLQRPENIRMLVKAPVVNSEVADMVSDGSHFWLAIYYPKNKRQFVRGTNLDRYEELTASALSESQDSELAQAGGLLNMRPQHITDAFLIKPTQDDAQVVREEVRQIERDDRPGKRNKLVERSYYVLYVIERGVAGGPELRRKFWFDRTIGGTPLVRQQTFDNGSGRLASDISYSDWFSVPNNHWVWPGRVLIDRRNDGYRIDLRIVKSSVEINTELPETTFILENTQGLKDVDLDARRKMSASPGRTPQAVPPKPQR